MIAPLDTRPIAGHRPLRGYGGTLGPMRLTSRTPGGLGVATPVLPVNGEVFDDAPPISVDGEILPPVVFPTPLWWPVPKAPIGMECEQAAPPEGYHYQRISPGIRASSGGWLECPTYRMVPDFSPEDVPFEGFIPDEWWLNKFFYKSQPPNEMRLFSSTPPVTPVSTPTAIPSSLTQPVELSASSQQPRIEVETDSQGQTRIVFTTGKPSVSDQVQDTLEKAKDWLTSDSIYGGVENYWIVGGAAAVLYFFGGRRRR